MFTRMISRACETIGLKSTAWWLQSTAGQNALSVPLVPIPTR
jgi:hypothetical protein